MSRHGWRPDIESALTLDLPAMFAKGAVCPDCATWGTWRWFRDGEQVAGIDYSGELEDDRGELTLKYTLPAEADSRRPVTYVLRLSSRPLTFGGRYWYLHCPYTGRAARKLYKFGGIEKFCHRTEIQPLPTYYCQRVSGHDRIVAQRWAIRKRVGDRISTLSDELIKPRWTRRRTFEEYAARDADLAVREESYMPSTLGYE